MSVFNTCSQQYHNTCVWCCWHTSRRSDVEPRCAVPCFQAEECTRMRRGTLVNACWNYGWTTDVMYNILMMFLLPFWALNMVVAMLSMQGQKALGFHQKYLKVIQILKYCSKTVRFSSLGYKTRYNKNINAMKVIGVQCYFALIYLSLYGKKSWIILQKNYNTPKAWGWVEIIFSLN